MEKNKTIQTKNETKEITTNYKLDRKFDERSEKEINKAYYL